MVDWEYQLRHRQRQLKLGLIYSRIIAITGHVNLTWKYSKKLYCREVEICCWLTEFSILVRDSISHMHLQRRVAPVRLSCHQTKVAALGANNS